MSTIISHFVFEWKCKWIVAVKAYLMWKTASKIRLCNANVLNDYRKYFAFEMNVMWNELTVTKIYIFPGTWTQNGLRTRDGWTNALGSFATHILWCTWTTPLFAALYATACRLHSGRTGTGNANGKIISINHMNWIIWCIWHGTAVISGQFWRKIDRNESFEFIRINDDEFSRSAACQWDRKLFFFLLCFFYSLSGRRISSTNKKMLNRKSLAMNEWEKKWQAKRMANLGAKNEGKKLTNFSLSNWKGCDKSMSKEFMMSYSGKASNATSAMNISLTIWTKQRMLNANHFEWTFKWSSLIMHGGKDGSFRMGSQTALHS